MTGGKIMDATLKQRHDPKSRMSNNSSSARRGAALGCRFSEPLGRFLALNHSQPDSLSVFKTNFAERSKHSVFVESFDGFCHEVTSSIRPNGTDQSVARGGVLSNHETGAFRYQSRASEADRRDDSSDGAAKSG
jgi:hypothetical protein